MMAKLSFTANPNHVSAKTTFSPIPVDDYLLQVVSCEAKDTSVGKALNIGFQVLDGPYKNRRIWVMYNLLHPDAEVVQRAEDQMQDLSKALGIVGQVDTDDLLHKPLIGRVYLTKPRLGHDQKNGINRFRPANMLYPPGTLPMTPAQSAGSANQKILSTLDAKLAESASAPLPAPPQPLTAVEKARAVLAKIRAGSGNEEPPF